MYLFTLGVSDTLCMYVGRKLTQTNACKGLGCSTQTNAYDGLINI
jgi:hypothetical protein